MHFIYIDETGDEGSVGYSALSIPVLNFREAFNQIKQFRRDLKRTDGIYTTTELHACKFTAGRGRLGQKNARGIRQERRAEIFNEVLRLVAQLPNVCLVNAFRFGIPGTEKAQLLERLLNRPQKAVEGWGSQALLIFDDGDSKRTTALSRQLCVYNPIRSQFGRWQDGNEYRNIPIVNLLEDPVFRTSHASYFIQIVDFCAYALFQREKPTPSRARLGLNESFDKILAPICNRAAHAGDSRGIIR